MMLQTFYRYILGEIFECLVLKGNMLKITHTLLYEYGIVNFHLE